ncbi:MAG TPA: hypothetical protein VFE59_37425 [Trebonia sp.]|jgi:hypothetical protein|nr:hypothetical protein [Trebonia sp.]
MPVLALSVFETPAGPLGPATHAQDHVPRVPDGNRAWLGKQNAPNGETGDLALTLIILVETGTRALPGEVSGPGSEGNRPASCCP